MKRCIASLLLLCVVFVTGCAGNTVQSQSTATTAPQTTEPVYTWLIAPEFVYEDMFYCCTCGAGLVFPDGGKDHLIDPHTGEITPRNHGGHGFDYSILAYNEATQTYGYYGTFFDTLHFTSADLHGAWRTIGERVGEKTMAVGFLPVVCVNTTASPASDPVSGVPGTIQFSVATANNPAKYGYANKDKMVTGFDFDAYDQNAGGTRTPAVCKNGKWGFINAAGTLVVDFLFDDAISTETGKAWVKQDGKWGIIQITPAAG